MLQWSFANLGAWAVQAAALVAAGVWLPMRLKLGAPRARLLLFRALLVVCIALPLVQPWKPGLAGSPAGAALGGVELSLSGQDVRATRPGAAIPVPSRLETVRAWAGSLPVPLLALAVLGAGMVGRLLWLAIGLVSLARLRRSSVPVPTSVAAVGEAESTVGAHAAFRQSSRVPRPVTFGLRHPIVLVPPRFVALDHAQQLAVACHELLHVRRQDWIRSLGDELIRSLLWFHPAIWWLVEQIHLAAEQVVDREVVRLVGDRKSYLRALLALAESGPRPRLQPASCFLDHGHLRQRVAMLMEDVPMSRLRLLVSCALVMAGVMAGGWYAVQAFPLRGASLGAPVSKMLAPSLPGPTAAAPALVAPTPSSAPGAGAPPQSQLPKPGVPVRSWDEPALKRQIQVNPRDVDACFALARLQENRGDAAQALATLEAALKAAPDSPAVFVALASYHHRHGDFDKTIAALTRRAALQPANPESYYVLATYYWEKSYRGTDASESDRRTLAERGLEQIDKALTLDADYVDALVYKNLLLRQLALLEPDEARRAELVADADRLRSRALELRKTQGTKTVGVPVRNPYLAADDEPGMAPPPPPPPPPMNKVTGGIEPLRVGDKILAPRKIVDVPPVIPDIAQKARVQGVVVLDILIDRAGKVAEVKVLRSIPLLDQAAIDTVRRWEYTPTLLNGTPIPVIMSVTVAFTAR